MSLFFLTKRTRSLRRKGLRKKNKNVIIKDNNKKGEKMSYNKTNSSLAKGNKSLSSSSTYYKQSHPRLYNVDYNPKFTKKNFKFVVSELVKGVSFCVTHFKHKNDFEINYHRDESRNYYNDFCSLEANINAQKLPLYEPMRKLAGILGGGEVDFTVFLEYITLNNQRSSYITSDDTAKILVYDIFINDNWIPYDQLKSVCDSCGLQTMPILYLGKYDEKIFNTFLNEVPSMFNKADKFGLIVKSFIEDTENNKRNAEILINKKFKKEVALLYPPDEVTISNEEISKKVEDKIKERFNKPQREMIDRNVSMAFPDMLRKQKIYKKDFPGKLLSHAVKQSVSFYFNGIELEFSLFNKILTRKERKLFVKELKKQLSNIFIERYDLFKRG